MPYHTSYCTLTNKLVDDCANIAQYAPDVWKKKDFETLLTQQNQLCIVAMQSSTCVGFAAFSLVDTGLAMQAILEMLVVHPNYRKLNIATQLLQNAFISLRLKNITECILELRSSNTPAYMLYKKLGFKQIAVRPHMYSNPKEDGLCMRKILV